MYTFRCIFGKSADESVLLESETLVPLNVILSISDRAKLKLSVPNFFEVGGFIEVYPLAG